LRENKDHGFSDIVKAEESVVRTAINLQLQRSLEKYKLLIFGCVAGKLKLLGIFFLAYVNILIIESVFSRQTK